MSENIQVLNVTSDDLIELTKAAPTIKVTTPIYTDDGKTRQVNEEGLSISGAFTLKRPTAGEGLRFAKFQRGKFKGKKMVQPSQQEVSIEAVRTCLPDLRQNTPEEVLNLIVKTGGYIGDNAVLVNSCLRLLGQNFDDVEEDIEKPWASEEILPT